MAYIKKHSGGGSYAGTTQVENPKTFEEYLNSQLESGNYTKKGEQRIREAANKWLEAYKYLGEDKFKEFYSYNPTLQEYTVDTSKLAGSPLTSYDWSGSSEEYKPNIFGKFTGRKDSDDSIVATIFNKWNSSRNTPTQQNTSTPSYTGGIKNFRGFNKFLLNYYKNEDQLESVLTDVSNMSEEDRNKWIQDMSGKFANSYIADYEANKDPNVKYLELDLARQVASGNYDRTELPRQLGWNLERFKVPAKTPEQIKQEQDVSDAQGYMDSLGRMGVSEDVMTQLHNSGWTKLSEGIQNDPWIKKNGLIVLENKYGVQKVFNKSGQEVDLKSSIGNNPFDKANYKQYLGSNPENKIIRYSPEVEGYDKSLFSTGGDSHSFMTLLGTIPGLNDYSYAFQGTPTILPDGTIDYTKHIIARAKDDQDNLITKDLIYDENTGKYVYQGTPYEHSFTGLGQTVSMPTLSTDLDPSEGVYDTSWIKPLNTGVLDFPDMRLNKITSAGSERFIQYLQDLKYQWESAKDWKTKFDIEKKYNEAIAWIRRREDYQNWMNQGKSVVNTAIPNTNTRAIDAYTGADVPQSNKLGGKLEKFQSGGKMSYEEYATKYLGVSPKEDVAIEPLKDVRGSIGDFKNLSTSQKAGKILDYGAHIASFLPGVTGAIGSGTTLVKGLYDDYADDGKVENWKEHAMNLGMVGLSTLGLGGFKALTKGLKVTKEADVLAEAAKRARMLSKGKGKESLFTKVADELDDLNKISKEAGIAGNPALTAEQTARINTLVTQANSKIPLTSINLRNASTALGDRVKGINLESLTSSPKLSKVVNVAGVGLMAPQFLASSGNIIDAIKEGELADIKIDDALNVAMPIAGWRKSIKNTRINRGAGLVERSGGTGNKTTFKLKNSNDTLEIDGLELKGKKTWGERVPLRGKGAEERIAKEQKEAIAKKYNEKNGTNIKAEDIEHIELKGATKGTGEDFIYDPDKLNDSNFYRNMEDLEAFKKKLGNRGTVKAKETVTVSKPSTSSKPVENVKPSEVIPQPNFRETLANAEKNAVKTAESVSIPTEKTKISPIIVKKLELPSKKVIESPKRTKTKRLERLLEIQNFRNTKTISSKHALNNKGLLKKNNIQKVVKKALGGILKLQEAGSPIVRRDQALVNYTNKAVRNKTLPYSAITTVPSWVYSNGKYVDSYNDFIENVGAPNGGGYLWDQNTVDELNSFIKGNGGNNYNFSIGNLEDFKRLARDSKYGPVHEWAVRKYAEINKIDPITGNTTSTVPNPIEVSTLTPEDKLIAQEVGKYNPIPYNPEKRFDPTLPLNTLGYLNTLYTNKESLKHQLAGLQVPKLITNPNVYGRESYINTLLAEKSKNDLNNKAMQYLRSTADFNKATALGMEMEDKKQSINIEALAKDISTNAAIRNTLFGQNATIDRGNIATINKQGIMNTEAGNTAQKLFATEKLANNAAFQNYNTGLIKYFNDLPRKKLMQDYLAKLQDPNIQGGQDYLAKLIEQQEADKKTFEERSNLPFFEEIAWEGSERQKYWQDLIDKFTKEYKLKYTDPLNKAQQGLYSAMYAKSGGSLTLNDRLTLEEYKASNRVREKNTENFYKVIIENNKNLQKVLEKLFK